MGNRHGGYADIFSHDDGPRPLVDDNFGRRIRLDLKAFHFADEAHHILLIGVGI